MWAFSDRSLRRARGYSLVEVIVASTLLGLLTAAVLTSYVFLLRGQQSLQNYAEMNASARQLLEVLSRDARSAVDVEDFSAASLTLTVPRNTTGDTQEVTYAYDQAGAALRRTAGGVTSTLATGVDRFAFSYLNGNSHLTSSPAELKQVQLSLHLSRSVALAATSQYVISAQYTLRAKPTSH